IVHAHSLPPREENIGEDTAKRVPLDKRVYFIPDVLTSELMWFGVTTLIMVVLVTWFYHAPLENHADPQVTPLGTTAPWYFLWLQGMLKLGDKTLMGVILPTIIIIFLCVIPYLDTTPSRRWAHRRFAFTVSFVLLAALVILSYMGLAEFGVRTSADAEIIHELVKEPAHNHMGVLLPVPFEQLVPGMYTTREMEALPGEEADVLAAFNEEVQNHPHYEELLEYMSTQQHITLSDLNFTPVPADATQLREVMHQFAEMLEEDKNELHDAWGAVIITDAQNNLRRIDVLIFWDDVQMDNGRPVLDADGNPVLLVDEDGVPLPRWNSQHISIHRNSQYFEAPGV